MPQPLQRPQSTPSSALSAFLRGIERRAWVLALAQCGDPALARAALAETLRAFRQIAAATPLSGWPAGFWALLLAQPELARGRAGLPELAALADGPRAALLLRLVAGLDGPHAAQVLGLSEAAYRQTSQRALQQFGEAGTSFADLAALRERLHQQVKTLPEAELRLLAELHAATLADTPAPPAAPPARWPLRLAWGGLVALLLAFAATFLPRAAIELPGQAALAPGEVQPLPPEPLPPRPALSGSDAILHPDFALLAAAPEEQALAQDLALLAWLTASPEAFAAESPATAEASDAH